MNKMAKRKRQTASTAEATPDPSLNKKSKSVELPERLSGTAISETIQIVAGSYDRVLHGMTATVGKDGDVDFADTFLFNAHTSAIRCVAVSPPSAPIPGQTQKVLLASGSTDERIQIYNLSAHPPSRKSQELLANVAPRPILENPKNRELGTLLHHESTVTALRFPTRSKLLSSSDDSTIAVTRTRDWSNLSSIKTPIPNPQGRPSGDTAAFGSTPSGVNDFAIHPSMKLMISVGKGEKCMRLWNLVTGKKAGVLSFGRDMLQDVGERRHSTGEGRRVVWGSADGADEFAVGFDRNIVVFGMDSVPKCRIMPTTKVKIHQFSYITLDEESNQSLLAVGTEDGRIAFFSTQSEDLSTPEAPSESRSREPTLPLAKLVGYVGGAAGRIKEFAILPSKASSGTLYLVGASSDGKIRMWTIRVEELQKACKKPAEEKPIGKLSATYETQNRITCMTAYLMIARPDGVEDSEDEAESEGDEDNGNDDDSDSE